MSLSALPKVVEEHINRETQMNEGECFLAGPLCWDLSLIAFVDNGL